MSGHCQLQCNSLDIIAVKVWIDKTKLLIFSVYISPLSHRQMSEEISIQTILNEIKTTIREATTDAKSAQIILARDFNHHHPA